MRRRDARVKGFGMGAAQGVLGILIPPAILPAACAAAIPAAIPATILRAGGGSGPAAPPTAAGLVAEGRERGRM